MKDYDYTYDVIEKIIAKRSLTDKRWLGIMSEIFDRRWFDQNRGMATLIDLSVRYFKKYMAVPTTKTLQVLIRRKAEKEGKPEESSGLNECLMSLDSFDIPLNDVCANKNVEKYISEKGLYFAISDNVAEITKTGNVEKCLKRFEKIQKTSLEDDDLGLNYFSQAGQERHWKYIENPEAKISTGWDGLDRYTNGGFLKDGRMLAIFVGQPGLGKSLFLSNIAVNFLRQNKSVVVISLEMSENVYGMRFDSAITKDNINRLKHTAKTSKEKIAEFYNRHHDANLIIKEYPPSTKRVIDIEVYLDKLVEKGVKFDAVIVDYMNLLVPSTKQDNTYLAVKQIVEQLRALSYKYQVPVISASQANRSGINNTDINLENISESNGTAATADFIGMLFQSDEDREHGVVNMRIAKNRLGMPGKVIQFKLDPDSLVLTDASFTDTGINDASEADRVMSNLSEISDNLQDL